jgi:hypothetical protein
MYIDNLTISGLIIAIGFVAGLYCLTRRGYDPRPGLTGE